jgi:hypothetical protein
MILGQKRPFLTRRPYARGIPPHIACATAQAITSRPIIRSTQERELEDGNRL